MIFVLMQANNSEFLLTATASVTINSDFQVADDNQTDNSDTVSCVA